MGAAPCNVSPCGADARMMLSATSTCRRRRSTRSVINCSRSRRDSGLRAPCLALGLSGLLAQPRRPACRRGGQHSAHSFAKIASRSAIMPSACGRDNTARDGPEHGGCPMPSHKFHVGEIVSLRRAVIRNAPGGAYKVTKQLPHNGREFEYLIKSANEEHERV